MNGRPSCRTEGLLLRITRTAVVISHAISQAVKQAAPQEGMESQEGSKGSTLQLILPCYAFGTAGYHPTRRP